MDDPVSTTLVILVGACVALLFLIFMTGARLGARLARIERLLEAAAEATPAAAGPPTALRASEPEAPEAPGGSGFEEFLREDPARRALSKSEQFAAYREWRQQRGLNWSGT